MLCAVELIVLGGMVKKWLDMFNFKNVQMCNDFNGVHGMVLPTGLYVFGNVCTKYETLFSTPFNEIGLKNNNKPDNKWNLSPNMKIVGTGHASSCGQKWKLWKEQKWLDKNEVPIYVL